MRAKRLDNSVLKRSKDQREVQVVWDLAIVAGYLWLLLWIHK
jgi:hypothetical protein